MEYKGFSENLRLNQNCIGFVQQSSDIISKASKDSSGDIQRRSHVVITRFLPYQGHDTYPKIHMISQGLAQMPFA